MILGRMEVVASRFDCVIVHRRVVRTVERGLRLPPRPRSRATEDNDDDDRATESDASRATSNVVYFRVQYRVTETSCSSGRLCDAIQCFRRVPNDEWWNVSQLHRHSRLVSVAARWHRRETDPHTMQGKCWKVNRIYGKRTRGATRKCRRAGFEVSKAGRLLSISISVGQGKGEALTGVRPWTSREASQGLGSFRLCLPLFPSAGSWHGKRRFRPFRGRDERTERIVTDQPAPPVCWSRHKAFQSQLQTLFSV